MSWEIRLQNQNQGIAGRTSKMPMSKDFNTPQKENVILSASSFCITARISSFFVSISALIVCLFQGISLIVNSKFYTTLPKSTSGVRTDSTFTWTKKPGAGQAGHRKQPGWASYMFVFAEKPRHATKLQSCHHCNNRCSQYDFIRCS